MRGYTCDCGHFARRLEILNSVCRNLEVAAKQERLDDRQKVCTLFPPPVHPV